MRNCKHKNKAYIYELDWDFGYDYIAEECVDCREVLNEAYLSDAEDNPQLLEKIFKLLNNG